MTGKPGHNFFLYDFLTSSRLRVWRHVLLVFIILTIALNQTYNIYVDYYSKLDGMSVLSTVAIMISYLLAIYYNLYILVPRFLFSGKYFKYLSGVILSVFVLVILLDFIEYGTFVLIGLPVNYSVIFDSYNSLFIDFIFTFSLLVICITGGSVTLLLRQWQVETGNITRMKNNYLQSEIEQLKERISPEFLFNILNKAGRISIDNPDEASSVLVKLSRILRYRLYDCARETVLLSSEIMFIRNYLNLYELCEPYFEYGINVEGEPKHIFVPPLLFLPLVQQLIEKEKGNVNLNIRFAVTCNSVEFICSVTRRSSESITEASNFENIHRRLEYLYKDAYTLTINNKEIILQINQL